MDNEIQNILKKCTGFEWDKGNSRKNWINHQVTPPECEQIFFNQPLIIHSDLKHSEYESRFYALGKTDQGRKLFIAFTIRNDQIRVISARNMTRKEKEVYWAS